MRIKPRAPTLRWYYEFSKGVPGGRLTRARFFALLERCDCERFARLVRADLARPPEGALRSLEEIRRRTRAGRPALEALLREPRPDEQTLQWMFLERGHLERESEKVVERELPVSAAHRAREGWVDLLVVERDTQQPTLVELKQAEATDPLTGVLLEVLGHWAFHVRHRREFAVQLASDGLVTPETMPLPQAAIVAPEAYFRAAVRRSSYRRRCDEVRVAARLIDCMRDRFGVDVRLLAVDDDWQDRGTKFGINDWTIPDA